jgi:hypothetical protein
MMLTAFLAVLPFHAFFQTDSLPATLALEASIDRFWARATAAQLEEYADTRKDDWMLWLPGVGLTYTPSGAPRPTLSYSLHEWFNARKAKRERAAKCKSIEATNRLNVEKDKTKLIALLRRRALLLADIDVAVHALETHAEIFRIYEQEYLHGEMTPTEFLPRKAQFEERQAALAAKRLQVDLLETEIMEAAHEGVGE